MPDSDLTELVDIDASRIDLVKNPANGFPILLMKAVGASGQVNEKPDIAGAEKVLRQLAALIISEAQELAVGNWEEICDIDLLSSAVHMMTCFMGREQMAADAQSVAKELADIERLIAERADSAPEPEKENNVPNDTTDKNTETSPAETPEVVTPDAPVEKSLGELVQEEVAKAVQPFDERNKALEAEMALLKSTPIPGGPMVTVPGSQRNDAARATSLAEAQRFDNLAKDISGNPELTRYYQEKAAEARKAANG